MQNQPKDSVILAGNNDLLLLVLDYTKNFTFSSPSCFTSLQYKELISRLAISYKLLQYDISFLRDNRLIDSSNSPVYRSTISNFISALRYNRYHQPQTIFPSLKELSASAADNIDAVPLEVKSDILREYSNYNPVTTPYRLDYIVVERNHALNQNLFTKVYYRKVFTNNNYVVYQLNIEHYL